MTDVQAVRISKHSRHPHPDKRHVVRQVRRYLLACKRQWGSARGLVHYRDLISTYLTAKAQVHHVTAHRP